MNINSLHKLLKYSVLRYRNTWNIDDTIASLPDSYNRSHGSPGRAVNQSIVRSRGQVPSHSNLPSRVSTNHKSTDPTATTEPITHNSEKTKTITDSCLQK